MSATTTTTARWHPATKLLLLGAALAIPYLLWTGQDPGTPATVAAVSRVDDPAAAPVGAGSPGGETTAGRGALPPLHTFAAVVERPLFAPTRRFIRPVGPPSAEPEPEIPEEAAAEVAAEVGPERPDLRFFGTIRRSGKVAALVTGGYGGDGIERLEVGDAVGDWQVADVTRDRLVLVHEKAEAAEYAIFSGSGAAPPAPGGSTDEPEEAKVEADAETDTDADAEIEAEDE